MVSTISGNKHVFGFMFHCTSPRIFGAIFCGEEWGDRSGGERAGLDLIATGAMEVVGHRMPVAGAGEEGE